MLSWLTLCRALICGHLNTGLVWAGLRVPPVPQNKLGKSQTWLQFQETTAITIPKYSNTEYIGGLEYPRKGETLYRN